MAWPKKKKGKKISHVASQLHLCVWLKLAIEIVYSSPLFCIYQTESKQPNPTIHLFPHQMGSLIFKGLYNHHSPKPPEQYSPSKGGQENMVKVGSWSGDLLTHPKSLSLNWIFMESGWVGGRNGEKGGRKIYIYI